jgi:hypothetical protein
MIFALAEGTYTRRKNIKKYTIVLWREYGLLCKSHPFIVASLQKNPSSSGQHKNEYDHYYGIFF